MSIIDDYLKKIEPAKRKQLERIREIAKKMVPEPYFLIREAHVCEICSDQKYENQKRR